MSAPLTAELLSVALSKANLTFRLLGANKILFNKTCKFNSLCSNYSLKNTVCILPTFTIKLGWHPTVSPAESYTYNPFRQYGRKVRNKPPKVTYFQYSGDLRKIPDIDSTSLVYPFQDLESQIVQQDETIKKLSSLEYASEKEIKMHKREVILDRIIQLFGPASELEQEIASLTLTIREKIPYCIANRTDKLSKIWLLKSIFRRRRLLTQLREIDQERFEWLLRELKIQYVLPRDREEYKGWKYNLRKSTENEATAKQREKLAKLRESFEAEKKAFLERKATVLAEIEKDLQKFGLSHDFLDQVQVVKKYEPVKEVKQKKDDDEPVKVSKKRK